MEEKETSGVRLGAYVRKLARNEGEVLCNICNAALTGAIVCCPVCDTPYHPDCWDYNKGCSVYGCKASSAGGGSARPFEVSLAQRRTAAVKRQMHRLAAASLLLGVVVGVFLANLRFFGPAAVPPGGGGRGAPSKVAAPRESGADQPEKEEWIRRNERLEALKHVKDPEALQEMTEALRTPDELPGGVHVRMTAAKVLGEGGWKAAAPDLLRALEREKTFFARPAYAIALYQLGHPEGLSKLRQLLERYKPGMDRLAPEAYDRQLTAMSTASAAASGRVTELGPILVSYLEDTDPEIVKQVLSDLKLMEYRQAVPAISRLLVREDCATVWAACEVLVAMRARSERARIEARLRQCPAYVSGLPWLLQTLDSPALPSATPEAGP